MRDAEQEFLKDVAKHQMHILRDDGVYRHIRFKRPDSGCMHFDLVTYPGYLVYSGDMGCFVFSRLNDMFEFFRMGKDDWNYNRNGGLSINLGYWSEKLQAVDGQRSGGSAKEFNPEKFAKVISDIRLEWIRSGRLDDPDDRRQLWEAVREQVLDRVEEGEHVAHMAANEFFERYADESFQFEDIWDYDFTDYTFRFVWCCYALAWGIKFYDDAKALA